MTSPNPYGDNYLDLRLERYRKYLPSLTALGPRPTDDPERAEQWDIASFNRRELFSWIDTQEDKKLNLDQQNKILAQDQAQYDATLRAQEENQQRQLAFSRQQAERQLQFQTQGLQLQRDRAADERQYRDQLLKRQDKQLAFDREERARVSAETKRQFELNFQNQKRQFDKTFAFNKERAEKNDKTRIQAQVYAEQGARRKIESDLGYGPQKRDRVGSPLEGLLVRLGRQQQNRPRLKEV